MASDTVFGSSSSEQRWFNLMKKTLDGEHIISIDIPVCVFHVPQTLSNAKPEAYAPQQLGFGPYHHLRPQLYQMQKHKLAALKTLMQPNRIPDFPDNVLAEMMNLELTIVACYDQYLDFDKRTLACIFTIDGVFLLQFLLAYGKHGHVVNSAERKWAQDIMMLENQIPFILLQVIQKTIPASLILDRESSTYPYDDEFSRSDRGDHKIFFVSYEFCLAHSPLKLMSLYLPEFEESPRHLLHYMYEYIVNNRGPPAILFFSDEYATEVVRVFDDAKKVVDGVANLGVGGPIMAVLQFILALPWDNIFSLATCCWKSAEIEIQAEKIAIPSASELSNNADIKFSSLGPKGITDIYFNEEEATLYLPVITLNDDSEVILRNLVAYEAILAASGDIPNVVLAAYVDMMCGLINNIEDVKLLRKEGVEIIEGNMCDKRIADLFNETIKSTGEPDEQSALQNVIDRVNKHYHSRNKAKKSLCKRFQFCSITKKDVLTVCQFVIGFFLVVVLSVQAWCSVFGCRAKITSNIHILGFADI